MGLVKKLGIEKHVIFMNEFVDQTELFKYLSASDIYITPYTNEAQITSGTLSYALGAGSAVISTPYWHAAELLSEDRGRLFPFNDVQAPGRWVTCSEMHRMMLIIKPAEKYFSTQCPISQSSNPLGA